MEHTGARIQAGDISLYYELHGTGPVLTLVAGLGTGTWLWQKQLAAFSKHFTTLIFDNRGVGKSDKPPGPYSVSIMAADLASLLEMLQIERTHLLGVSLGGFIVQEFALIYPEKTDRLILAATGNGGSDMVAMSEPVRRQLLAAVASREAMKEKLALAFSPDFMESDEIDALIDMRIAETQPYSAFLAQAQAGSDFDRAADVHKIRASTLVLASTGDQIVPVDNAHILSDKIPGCRLKIYQGAGHQFWVECAENFNRDVVDFLVTT